MLRSMSSTFGGSKLRLAIIGSGPAGFYTAHQIIKKVPNVLVDIIEKLPVPFGLVRFGVAPDHPEVKNVINQFSDLARSERCRFIGNVNVGKDVSVSELKQFYNGIVLSYGAENDNLLNIPGENVKGVHSARSFVGWYNGLPEHVNLNPDLSGKTAVIIGQGNVALDVARILLSPLEMLKTTDISSLALEGLRQSNISKVILIGRRGPLQVALTIKELREMTRLPDCQSIIHSKDFDQCRSHVDELARPRRRITELLIKTADTASKSWELKFLSSPVEIVSSTNGTICGVKLEKNQLTDDNKAKGTGEFEEVECSLLMRSIGYKSDPIDSSVPFDLHRGIIPNRNGRVVDVNEQIVKGLYCSGWVKRGPIGVIVTTMNDAFLTAESIIDDINNNHLLPFESKRDILEIVKEPVLFSDWEKIDNEEQKRGEERNKPREKIVSIEEMLRIVR